METKKIDITLDDAQTMINAERQKKPEGIIEAAELLKKGELVAFPTETVYGLGANALDSQACQQIFKVKGRPADNPLIVHVASVQDARRIVKEWPAAADLCAREFWPGPLTLVLPKTDLIPDIVSGGLDTVAVRMPQHPVALALIRTAGIPLAAPSANTSGKPSPTEGKYVWQDLKGKIPLIIDAGKCSVGLESTVLDLCGEKPIILRPGGITLEQLTEVLGEVLMDVGVKGEDQSLLQDELLFQPRSPGMKYRHYAPEGEVILLREADQEKVDKIRRYTRNKDTRKKIALLCMEETKALLQKGELEQIELVFVLGSKNKPNETASRLFEGLRICDDYQINIILAEEMPEEGIGLAFMNRLKKAAGKKEYSKPEKI